MSSEEDEEAKEPSEPFVMILDNAQMMDIASWELYEAIRDGCFRITLILIIQTDSNEDMKVHS